MKERFSFNVSIETDKATGKLLAVYFRIREGKSAKVIELANGNAFADYNSRGKLLGVEMLGPCDVKVLDQIARKEPQQIKDFLKGSAPRELVLA